MFGNILFNDDGEKTGSLTYLDGKKRHYQFDEKKNSPKFHSCLLEIKDAKGPLISPNFYNWRYIDFHFSLIGSTFLKVDRQTIDLLEE